MRVAVVVVRIAPLASALVDRVAAALAVVRMVALRLLLARPIRAVAAVGTQNHLVLLAAPASSSSNTPSPSNLS
jgi:hypothetical protein